MVGDQFALTAGHVVSIRNFGGWASQVLVSPGLDASSPPNNLPYGQYYSYQGKATNLWTDYEDSDVDFALLKLDRAVTNRQGNTPGSMGIAALSENALDRQWINVTGYPGDKGIPDPNIPIIAQDGGRTL